MNDLIFRQVRILDGSGGEELIGDVSVRQGRINEVGTVTEGLAPSCLLYTSPSPRDATLSRMPSSA